MHTRLSATTRQPNFSDYNDFEHHHLRALVLPDLRSVDHLEAGNHIDKPIPEIALNTSTSPHSILRPS